MLQNIYIYVNITKSLSERLTSIQKNLGWDPARLEVLILTFLSLQSIAKPPLGIFASNLETVPGQSQEAPAQVATPELS